MHTASFRFYAQLNDFLPGEQRQQSFEYRFRGKPGIKDAIEALGPPHTEIDLILVNSQPVDFEYALRDGDRVSVYPRFGNVDISSLDNVRPPTLEPVRFVLDMHLGRLTTYLRMIGFDCLYWNQASDEHLAQISQSEIRILLTRDRGLLKRGSVRYGYCVRCTNPREQLEEVVSYFDLVETIKPFRRCMRCNGKLHSVEKEAVIDQLPPGVRERHDKFRQCSQCARVYWRGSHFERMQRLIESVRR
jgi:uncharacterized protein with PIN domain